MLLNKKKKKKNILIKPIGHKKTVATSDCFFNAKNTIKDTLSTQNISFPFPILPSFFVKISLFPYFEKIKRRTSYNNLFILITWPSSQVSFKILTASRVQRKVPNTFTSIVDFQTAVSTSEQNGNSINYSYKEFFQFDISQPILKRL